ncbi:MAG: hypothetical protein ACREDY_25310 [Bradyrhizobium sp.]
MASPLEVLGSAILRALVAVKAGLVIAAAAFLELAIASANQSKNEIDPLRTFFVILAIAFGSAAVIVVLLFIIEQAQLLRGQRNR